MTGVPKDPTHISPDLLRQLIDYDPKTGQMVWKARSPDMFSEGQITREQKCLAWNRKNAGKPALASKNARGYERGTLFTIPVLAHRVAWAIHYGQWPADLIDHRNGKASDNRIRNMRIRDRIGNARNRRVNANNKSGVAGVHWVEREAAWKATIMVNGEAVCLGYYSDVRIAAIARRRAEDKYGFTIRPD